MLKIDWKFIVSLLVAVAGLLVPYWLWQADLAGKALTLTIKSTVEIQPKGVSPLDGLEVVVDGKSLDAPVVTVLELTNAGTRAIVSGDFESPIRLVIGNNTTLVKLRLTESHPASLRPKVDILGNEVLLSPLLLNPGDRLTLNMVTSGGRPTIEVLGRIAGVADISINDQHASRKTRREWLSDGVAFLLVMLYFESALQFGKGLKLRDFRVLPLITAITCACASGLIGAYMRFDGNAAFFSHLSGMALAAFLYFILWLLRDICRRAS